MGRREIRRLLGRDFGLETEADEEEDEELPETSIEDLVSDAEPEQFDRTFLARQDDFGITGEFAPTTFPLQALPRLAYVVDYNMVYNEDEGVWEPQKKGADTTTADGDGEATGSVVSKGAAIVPNGGNQPAVSVEQQVRSPNQGNQPTVDVTVS